MNNVKLLYKATFSMNVFYMNVCQESGNYELISVFIGKRGDSSRQYRIYYYSSFYKEKDDMELINSFKIGNIVISKNYCNTCFM